jgi:hypothetical protein
MPAGALVIGLWRRGRSIFHGFQSGQRRHCEFVIPNELQLILSGKTAGLFAKVLVPLTGIEPRIFTPSYATENKAIRQSTALTDRRIALWETASLGCSGYSIEPSLCQTTGSCKRSTAD